MESFTPRKKGNPEKIIQQDIEKMMKGLDWFVKRTHGNAAVSGFPDDFTCHKNYGVRWVEVKLPQMKGSQFTPAQLETFPMLCAKGCGVWVLTGATEEEYKKLFGPPNWYQYLSIMKGA
jgi:hypothetical protein